MRKKLFIDIRNQALLAANKYNATTKPRLDTERIANQSGYQSMIFYTYSVFIDEHSSFSKKVFERIFWFIEKIRLAISLSRLLWLHDDILFFQYPFLNAILKRYLKLLKKHHCKLVFLFHDIDSFRSESVKDMDVFQVVNVAILHTDNMREELSKTGIILPSVILHFFDYLSDCKRSTLVDTKQIQIIFAGSFLKSTFVQYLDSVKCPAGMVFYLYGKRTPLVHESETVIYKGVFDSEEIDGIEGTWSLVWDGPSISTCEGLFGHYLKFNAPFKFSLSLAMGRPVIVWGESALAKYVRDYHLGICVSSLNDIYSTISKLTESQIEDISLGVSTYSMRVKSGLMLKDALLHAEKLLDAS